MKKILLVIVCSFLLIGCSSDSDNKIINYTEAKEKIINENAVLIDVRTEDEYNENHIDGAILLPLDSINKDSIEDIVSNKNDVIIVYCQSGRRSNQALNTLEELGYTKVYDLGSINNWEE